ncbi:MAG: hypothetical protein FWF92_05835 [Oscillospiraceae bacterium]|nr:hypothetical protein [Oscillospiraceae bacterium]
MKRILTVLLILIAIFTLILLSCGKEEAKGSDESNDLNKNNGNPENNIAAEDSTEPPTDNSQQEAFTPIEADYNGYKFRMIGFDSYQGSWKAVTYSEIFAETENGDPINDALYKRNRAVEELYNIEIALTPGVSYSDRSTHANTVLKSIMAGDDNFDAGLILGYQMPKILTTPNALIDLKTIQSLDLTNNWWDQKSVKELSVANRLYAVVGDISLYSAFGTVVIYSNKDLIQEFDLEDPYKLVKEGTWTWDKLGEMCRAVVKDLDGDNKITYKDQIGIMSESHSLIYSLVSGGQRLTVKDKDDLPVLTVNNERTVSGVDTVISVLRDKNTNMNTGDVTGYGNAFFEFTMPKFRDSQALFFYHQLYTALNLREMEADFGILPAPKLDASQEGYNSVASEWWITYLFVPQTNTDPERTGNILEALGYYSQKYVMPAFYDVTVTNKLVRDEGSVEMLDIILKNRVYDLASVYDWADISGIFRDIYDRAQNNFVSNYEKKEERIKTAIEKTIEEMTK